MEAQTMVETVRARALETFTKARSAVETWGGETWTRTWGVLEPLGRRAEVGFDKALEGVGLVRLAKIATHGVEVPTQDVEVTTAGAEAPTEVVATAEGAAEGAVEVLAEVVVEAGEGTTGTSEAEVPTEAAESSARRRKRN
jgi:hypothetical protein